MTNMEIISANLKLINTCIDCQWTKLKDKQFREDFRSDLILILNSYDNEKLNEMHNEGKLNSFITSIIIRNTYSHTSPYWKNYYRFQSKADEIGEKELEIADD